MNESKRLLRWSVPLVLFAWLGCKPVERHAAPVASTATAAPQASAAVRAPAAPAGFDALGVQRFIDRWLAVQNDHDFVAYRALNAGRFSGTKRVGSYSKRFDRASWLRDRRPMFRDGVAVHASELQLSGSAGAVRVVFTQDFVAPGFHDRGKKQLFLGAQPTGFAISREEMLESQVAEAAPLTESALLAFDQDGPVLESGFRQTLAGTPRLLPRASSDSYDVALPVEPAALSAALRAWLGRSITVYAKAGTQCQGLVARFEVRVKAEPHFGMKQAWDGEGGGPKAPAAQIARDIWGTANEDERFIVGVLDHECHGVWAAAHSAPFTAAAPVPAALRARALKAFQALPAYRELQARFARDATAPAQPWETVDGELSVLEVRTSPESALVVVAARAGVGCGGFGGDLSVIWQASGAGAALELAPRGVFQDFGDRLQVGGAVDQNEDGTLELLAGPDVFAGEISVLRRGASGYERKVLLKTSVWDCGC